MFILKGVVSKYAAGIDNISAFDNLDKEWNMNQLGDLFGKYRFPCMRIPGINTPFLYVGSLGSVFPFHIEDRSLQAMNYNHFGEPKFWYAISPSKREEFEAFCNQKYRGLVTEDQQLQEDHFLRYKKCFIPPETLSLNNIKYYKVIIKFF